MLPSPAAEVEGQMPQDPSRGLTTFIRRWEMNDFLFRIVVENLMPPGELPGQLQPWFLVVPDAWRARACGLAVQWFDVEPAEAAFFGARLITGVAFLIIAIALAWRASRGTLEDWLCAGFLTLAWFWLLAPTQNPWYWTWALPLLPFARSRAWLAVSGLTLAYYLRFWLQYQWPQSPVPGTPYPGELCFDFIVPWLEFGPLLAWLAIESFSRGLASRFTLATSRSATSPLAVERAKT
jgi:hypothetical protein